MKTRHVPEITMRWLPVAVVLAVVPWARLAAATATLDEQLLEAAGREDLQLVISLLEQGADFNAKTKSGTTALKEAKERGYKEILELLKAHGAKE